MVWRFGLTELVYPQTWTPGLREIGPWPAGTWGPVYPRHGFVTAVEPPKAAAVAAQRAADIATRTGQPHVYVPAPVEASDESSDHWQMISPKLDRSCAPFGTLAEYSPGRVSQDEKYGFLYWPRYEEKARLAIKNCRQAEAEIARGENPYDDWVVVVNNTEWRRQAQAGSTATEAEKSVRVEARHKGVIWRNGEAHGGDGQRAVHVIGDVARAGHEILTSGTSADPSTEPGLVESFFPSEDEAAEWTTDVLGELVIDFKDGSAPKQQAGTGLGPKIDALKLEVEELLTAMVHDRGQRTHENFQKVTAPAGELSPRSICTRRSTNVQ